MAKNIVILVRAIMGKNRVLGNLERGLLARLREMIKQDIPEEMISKLVWERWVNESQMKRCVGGENQEVTVWNEGTPWNDAAPGKFEN